MFAHTITKSAQFELVDQYTFFLIFPNLTFSQKSTQRKTRMCLTFPDNQQGEPSNTEAIERCLMSVTTVCLLQQCQLQQSDTGV